MEQVPDVDAVVIPVGGGGLIAGCAVALKTMNPNIKIIVSKNSSDQKKNLIVLIPFTHSFKLPYKKKTIELALERLIGWILPYNH